jgi:hypothetical protein
LIALWFDSCDFHQSIKLSNYQTTTGGIMNWSQLPSRNKALYIGLAVLIFAILTILALASRNQNVGASGKTGDAPVLDSGFDQATTTISFKTTNAAGAVKAAFLDGLANDTQDGVVGESDDTGIGTLDLSDGCWTVQATDKNGTDEGTLELAVGAATAGCVEGATKIESANSEPLTVKMQ